MAALESELMILMPVFINVEHLENQLNLDELLALINESRRIKHEEYKMYAALQGVDLGDGNSENAESKFDEIKARAEAKAAGETNATKLEFAGAEGLNVEVVDF